MTAQRLARRRFRLPIGLVLGAGLAGMVALAVAGVLYLGVWAGGSNTIDLSRDKAELVLTLVRQQLGDTLDPVRRAGEEIARTMQAEGIDPAQDDRFVTLAAGALAALPQTAAILFADADLNEVRVRRMADGTVAILRAQQTDPDIVASARRTYAATEIRWDTIAWVAEVGQPVLTLRVPLRRDGRIFGMLILGVTVVDLSRGLEALAAQSGTTPFILSGSDRVLAHPRLASGYGRRDRNAPLPGLDEVADPLLAGIWQQRDFLSQQRTRNIFDGRGHLRNIAGEHYVYVYRQEDRYGDAWLIGAVQKEVTLDTAIDRIVDAVVAGLVVLVLALALSLLLGRWIGRHLREFSAAARMVRDYDFGEAARVRRSLLRELDDTALAFNAMIDGLRWFESYVPRALVRRLMRSGLQGGIESVQRDLTIMFTDIAGFTTLSETMSAGEVATFLNRHFGLIDALIDGGEGTVDKHLGDGVMAFWGAPEPTADHAGRACLAALAIREAVEAENRARVARGEPAVRLRIGLHSGAATVGNIGAASRLSYTIVGDSVNAASRLCELAKQVPAGGRDVVILAGDETVARLPEGFLLESRGAHLLRGRQVATEVFQVLGQAEDGPAEMVAPQASTG